MEYLTIDWLAQNLYILSKNKQTGQQSISVLNIRTHKRRTLVKNQHIQPAILIVDPVKTDLYWMNHNSPSLFNIANLEGQVKKQLRFSSIDSNVTYVSYDPITHEVILVTDATVYGLNTLDRQRSSPRVLYEHSSSIRHALFVHPILYFTDDRNETTASTVHLHAIDVVAKSFAKNVARFKEFNSLTLFLDVAPTMPTSKNAEKQTMTFITRSHLATTVHRCATYPCSDICIALEHGQFRCLCGDDAK